MKDIFELQNPWRYKSDYSFNYHKRKILDELEKNLKKPKILGLIGSRQVGKSSLLYMLIGHLIASGTDKNDIYYFNLDNFLLHELFENIKNLLDFIGTKGEKIKYIFLDEIQRLNNPGLFLKELHDLKLNIRIIYSGSSQIEIKSKLKEHLTGRVRQFEIQRLSFTEFLEFNRPTTKNDALNNYLLYGAYPEVALTSDMNEKQLILRDIYQSYIEKDIVDLLHIDNITTFNRLLILLANQTGSLLNIDGISNSLKISRNTVEKWISILESTFIIKLVHPFFKNYKKEITKMPKVYYLDTGLRNFILKDFQDLELRNDKGVLFENFYLLELLNGDPYNLNSINFWRTTNQTEIDFIVRSKEGLRAIETKWEKSGSLKSFSTIHEYYPQIQTRLVTRQDFIS